MSSFAKDESGTPICVRDFDNERWQRSCVGSCQPEGEELTSEFLEEGLMRQIDRALQKT